MNKYIPIILLLAGGAGQLFYIGQKSQLQENMQLELKTKYAQLSDFEESLFILKGISADVCAWLEEDTIPKGGEALWVKKQIDFPHMPSNFKRSSKNLKRDIPMEQNLPMAVKLENRTIIPGLIAYQFNIALEGTLDQFSIYLTELERNNKSMIITGIDITPSGVLNVYKADVTMAVPQIATTEDQLRIHQFAISSPLLEQHSMTPSIDPSEIPR